MKPIDQELTSWLLDHARGLWGAEIEESLFQVRPTNKPEFGDYQCNAAMGLAKRLKTAPRSVAERLIADRELHPALEKIELAGPGFINLFLKRAWLLERVVALLESPSVGLHPVEDPKTVVLDFSSPNVAKPMHIGHLRSTNLGESLRRILTTLGHKVYGDNHLGDWGTQFGLLILGYRNFLDRVAFEEDPVSELERVYVRSYEASRADDAYLDQARSELVRLQQGDPDNLRLWEEFVAVSMREFDRIYRRLDIHFDMVRGESAYRGMLADVVGLLKEKGIARESEGATVVFFDDENLAPLIVQKKDGGFNYATTDLATIRYRVEELKADQIVYVTDERQQLHFRQIFAVARMLGFDVPLEHVWFGLMRLPEGTFSTRQGNVIKLEKLLDEAEARALVMAKASSDGEIGEDELCEIARVVGLGSVKYADLSQNRQTLVTFEWDRMLSLEGNTAPYLQYTYARIRSIWRKHQTGEGGADADWRKEAERASVFEEKAELDLAKALLQFSEVVERAGRLFRPNVIADYLFELCQFYNALYQNVMILKASPEARARRLLLCEAVSRTIKEGLRLMGIETVERM